jgi:hypothetical protein
MCCLWMRSFLRAQNILNCVGVILTTNYKTNGIYLPAEDRRHYVAWTHITPVISLMVIGIRYGAGTMMAAIVMLPLTLERMTYRPSIVKSRPVRHRFSGISSTPTGHHAELADVLDKMGNPKAVTLLMVIRDAGSDNFIKWFHDPRNSRAIPHRFEQCGYMPVRKPGVKQGLWIINGKRQVIYALANLSLRDQIAAAEELVRRSEPPKQEPIPF